MKPGRIQLMGMPLDVGLDPSEVVERLRSGKVLLSYLNPFAWSVAKKDQNYQHHLNAMDLVVCDGLAIQKALKRLHGQETSIISLDDSGIAPQYLRAFQLQGSRICLVGDRKEALNKARERLKSNYPGINIHAVFPGYEAGPEQARDFILETGSEVVLAGMGMGRQEAFLLSLKKAGWSGTGIAVGAYIDRLANPRHDYPGWSRRYNVRFLGNIARRPLYYLRRYGVDYLPFLKQYVRDGLRRNKSKE